MTGYESKNRVISCDYGFNDDDYRKRGRPVKTLLEQVLFNENNTVGEFCRLSLKDRISRLL